MPSDPHAPVVIASELSDPEATALIEHLRQRGIDARAWGGHVSRLYGTFIPRESMQVVVRQADAIAARQAAQEFVHSRPTVPAIVTENRFN